MWNSSSQGEELGVRQTIQQELHKTIERVDFSFRSVISFSIFLEQINMGSNQIKTNLHRHKSSCDYWVIILSALLLHGSATFSMVFFSVQNFHFKTSVHQDNIFCFQINVNRSIYIKIIRRDAFAFFSKRAVLRNLIITTRHLTTFTAVQLNLLC